MFAGVEDLSRRQALARLGRLLAGTLAAGRWGVRSFTGEAAASGAVKCTLTPEQTDGPFYIAGEKVRRNITERRAGMPLRLQLKVVDASTCRPIKGAAVDIWHCDAGGVYSGFGGGAASRTFMRGIQLTDRNGVAVFDTVYPGWYRGRTVHIHVKVHVGGNVVHTGQLYFSDRLTDAVYKKAPYSRRPRRDTRNATDAIYRNGGSRSRLAVRRRQNAAGYLGSITMGIRRS
jgi:protocatechuate 3,4-dioxygenase beta subunit